MTVLNTIATVTSPVLAAAAGLEPFTNKNNANKNNVNANANNNANRESAGEVTLIILLTVVLVLLFQVMPVMLIAVNCNPDSPIMYGIIAFLFPGIYLFQHTVRKYLMRTKGYCGNK